MAPRRPDASPSQPQSVESAALEELQEVMMGFELEATSIIERLARENEDLRAQLTATNAVATLFDAPLPSALEPGALLSGPRMHPFVGDGKQVREAVGGGEQVDGGIREVSGDGEQVEAGMTEQVVPGGGSEVLLGDILASNDQVGFGNDGLKQEDGNAALLRSKSTEPTPSSVGGASERRTSKMSSLDSYGQSVGSVRSSRSTRSVDSNAPILHRIARGLLFETFMSVCILLNCVTVGMWAHQLVTGHFSQTVEDFMEISEHCFVAIFLIELALKVHVFGCASFRFQEPATRGNFLDMMLVIVTGLMFTWLLPIAALIFGFDPSAGPFKTLSVLRTVRLARLVRVFQRSPLFREAWMLIRGLSDSARTLFWTCVVIFIVTYVFAIVGIATIVTELQALRLVETDPIDIAALDMLIDLMGGLDKIMATLVQVLLGDSFHTFTRECQRFIWWSWVYFYFYISIAVVVLMNLVTAIIVENAIETGKADHDHMATEKEAKKKKDIEMLRRLFRTLDTDGGGTLSWEEFEASFCDPEMARMWLALDFGQEDCEDLFKLLDDGDGEITISEFLEALFRMSGTAQSKDVFRLQKTMERVQHAIEGRAHASQDEHDAELETALA